MLLKFFFILNKYFGKYTKNWIFHQMNIFSITFQRQCMVINPHSVCKIRLKTLILSNVPKAETHFLFQLFSLPLASFHLCFLPVVNFLQCVHTKGGFRINFQDHKRLPVCNRRVKIAAVESLKKVSERISRFSKKFIEASKNKSIIFQKISKTISAYTESNDLTCSVHLFFERQSFLKHDSVFFMND